MERKTGYIASWVSKLSIYRGASRIKDNTWYSCQQSNTYGCHSQNANRPTVNVKACKRGHRVLVAEDVQRQHVVGKKHMDNEGYLDFIHLSFAGELKILKKYL